MTSADGQPRAPANRARQGAEQAYSRCAGYSDAGASGESAGATAGVPEKWGESTAGLPEAVMRAAKPLSEISAASGMETPEAPAIPQPPAPQASFGEMPAFSLSRTVAQVLPTALVSGVDGRLYPVDADFRTVLACLRWLQNPNRSQADKLIYLAARFFLRNPPPDLVEMFSRFVTGGEAGADSAPLFDFEQDAGAIYASFRQQYQMDLLTESLHWSAFRELLAGLGEHTAFGARVRLRATDEAQLPPEERAALRRAKERFALAPRVGQKEQALLEELNRRLAAGEDPCDVLAEIREG